MRATKGLDHENEGPGLHCTCSNSGDTGHMATVGGALWREEIFGCIDGHRGGNCQNSLKSYRQALGEPENSVFWFLRRLKTKPEALKWFG